MMSLVEDRHIPGRSRLQFFDPFWSFQGINRNDETVMGGKGIRLAVGHIAFATEDLKVEIKNVVQFPAPVFDETGRDNHDGPLHLAP